MHAHHDNLCGWGVGSISSVAGESGNGRAFSVVRKTLFQEPDRRFDEI
jgi:hypothetical protein